MEYDNIESALVRLFRSQTTPPAKIDEFDGNLLKHNYFVAAFCEAVEKKLENPVGRLTYLIQSFKGEAKELIRNCVQEDPMEGYYHTWFLLKTQYGNPYNPYVTARAYSHELQKWETVKLGDSKGFRKFYGFLVKCKTCMSGGVYLKELNFPDILQVLQSKLP